MKKHEESSDSDRDSGMSVNLVTKIKPCVKKVALCKPHAVCNSAAKNPMETIMEETDYQKKVKWLEDHGESDLDKSIALGKLLVEAANDESSKTQYRNRL